MQSKLFAAAAGVLSYGVLVGWAATADYYEQRIKEKNDHIKFLRSRPLGTITNVYQTTEGLHVEAELDVDVDDHPTLLTETGELHEDENPRGDETSEVDEAGVTEEIIEDAPESPETTRANLQALIDLYAADPEDVSRFVDHAERVVAPGAGQVPPFVISQETFSWDEEEGDEYEKLTITYYPKERVLLDDDNEVIDDVDGTIGWRNTSRFGDESHDPDVVFIRNRRLRTDFEVVRDEENQLPLHVKYGLGREEFEVSRAAGTIRLRPEDHGRS